MMPQYRMKKLNNDHRLCREFAYPHLRESELYRTLNNGKRREEENFPCRLLVNTFKELKE